MKNIKNIWGWSPIPKHSLSPILFLSKVCIYQALECQSSWIIDSGASDHIFGNASLFSSISHPKISHVITLANGSKITSQDVGQISP